ncbi:MAG TPA: sigma-54 dependent transcriptional regulator [Polyangia bacterium]|nr:sigma-54 dependent transcriptional regulator [Polyangia bacterium]
MNRPHPRVLIVDDHAEMARTTADGLAEHGYDTVVASGGQEAIERLSSESLDAVITDLRMPGVDGLAVLAASRRIDPQRPVIVMTAYSAIDSAVESIRQGAYHYLTKPFKLDELRIFLGRALDEYRLRHEATALRKTLQQRFSATNLIGDTPAIRAVIDVIERVADAEVPVLITGETGTGKGVAARALHAESRRSSASFVTVNCAAIPEALLESELFGHVRGAFTGATADRPGLFAEASGGTLFLDEIGEMPIGLQSKLLHVLESGTVRPVGSTRERKIDARIVAATNRDLKDAVRTGAFREDLLYRLDVVTISLPALRHHREDIPAILGHFLELARGHHPHSRMYNFTQGALKMLLSYSWPGNVRELAHTVERTVLLARGAEAGPEDLPPEIQHGNGPSDLDFRGGVIPMREVQRRYAAWALEQLGGQRGQTADRLGIDGKTLAEWLSESGPERPASEDPEPEKIVRRGYSVRKVGIEEVLICPAGPACPLCAGSRTWAAEPRAAGRPHAAMSTFPLAVETTSLQWVMSSTARNRAPCNIRW